MKKKDVWKNIVEDSENDDSDEEPLPRRPPSPPLPTTPPAPAVPPPPPASAAPPPPHPPRYGYVQTLPLYGYEQPPRVSAAPPPYEEPPCLSRVSAAPPPYEEPPCLSAAPPYEELSRVSAAPPYEELPYEEISRVSAAPPYEELLRVSAAPPPYEEPPLSRFGTGPGTSSTENGQKIQRVPTILRGDKDNKRYNPVLVAIGPYHYGKVIQMETFKFQCSQQYVGQSGETFSNLYGEMKELLNNARNYYDDVPKALNGEQFARMLFNDSCFVIQFMDNCVNSQSNDTRIKYIEKTLIMRDIMLLENQLPFKILIKLMSLSLRYKGGRGEKMIDDFIEQIMNVPVIEEEAHERKTCFWFKATRTSKEKKERIQKEPIHLLELVQTKFVHDEDIENGSIDDEEIRNGDTREPSPNWCLYRTVKELKSVGIHFQPSKTHRFSDITFKSKGLYGRLKLPRITIHDGTESLLLNLVAFETCADTSSNFGVSSYVYFMDTLIDHAEDVKELRSKGIIFNLLGCDDEVATLFNDINKNLVQRVRVFGKVKRSLNNFYTSHQRLWLAECLHNHFRSPWAIIAFFAAVVILGLTIAQTVFAAKG